MNSLFHRNPRGNTLLTVIILAAAVLIFGNMLLKMLISIAFGAVALAINVALFLLIVGGLYYLIRAVSGKAETK
jgi:hypothetical protein